MADISYRKNIKNFFINFNLLTEGLSFFGIVPAMLLYAWINIQLTSEQLPICIKIWSIGFVVGSILVLINNRIVALPIVRYFNKLLRDETVPSEVYAKAKKRFLMLPYIHAVGAFFRWIIIFGVVVLITTLFANLTTPQIVTLWTGIALCAVSGIVSYFSITEIYVQSLLNKGLFSESADIDLKSGLNLSTRLTTMAVSTVFFPIAILFLFFYITVEQNNIGSAIIYVKIGILAAISILAGLFSPVLLNRTIRDKVNIVVGFLKQIGKGDLHGDAQNIAVHDEIAHINSAVFDMKENLRVARDELLDLNLNLEKKVEDRTEELQSAMEELEAMNENLISVNKELDQAERIHRKDLAIAVSVQSTFLPKAPPQSDNYELAFVFKPMAGVSGDFYDFYENENRLEGVGIFDVSGHGISSGLLTLIAKSIILRNFNSLKKEKLNKVMESINKELIDEIGQSDNYLTGILLRFIDDRIEYVNSGHADLIYRSVSSKKAGKILNKEGESIKGLFLGIGAMDESFEELTVRLKKDDALFMFTDCLIEAENSNGQSYDETRIIESLQNAPLGSAQEILDYIMNDFNNFIEEKDNLSDDLTAIVIKKK